MRLHQLVLPVLLLSATALNAQSAHAQQIVGTWYQGQPPKQLLSQRDGVCFLTSVQGRFYGGGERVRVSKRDGQWYLDGSSAQEGVGGAATCVNWADVGATSSTLLGPFTWYQGQSAIQMTSTASSYCFLTEVSGAFRGGGESVRIRRQANAWVLDGASQQEGISASAYCIDSAKTRDSLSTQYDWQQGQNPRGIGSYPQSLCFLTGMVGRFEGDGERIYVGFGMKPSLFPDPTIYLGGTSAQEGVGASAECITLISPPADSGRIR